MKSFWENKWTIYIPTLVILIALPFLFGKVWTSLLTEMFILAIAASAANLMAGYSGMVSFGLAGFYGSGAYITALLITKVGLPFELAFLAGPIGAAILSLPIGWFCVRRTAIYFAMLSLAFSQLIYVIVYTWYSFTGGDNGIVGIPIPSYLKSTFSYYYFSLAIMFICLLMMKIFVNSPFGKTLNALRDNPERVSFIGTNVRRFQYSSFIISSFFLGVAGSLYCGFIHNVFADYANWPKTFEFTTVYLLGGMYNFLGPIGGAIVYLLLNKVIAQQTQYWPLILGIIIILITLFMPNGLVGSFSNHILAFKENRKRKNDTRS